MEKFYLAALQMVPGIGYSRLTLLLDHFGSAKNVWEADRRDLFLCTGIDRAVCNNLITHREKIDIHNLKAELQNKGIALCAFEDANYPILLKRIYKPPKLLYYYGCLPNHDRLIAIVGARKATAYGKNAASMLAAELAAAGMWVVSGAARGIDTAAHQGALSKGHTIAVLGCGIDVVYPPENKKLLQRIAEVGAVISEYPPGTPPHQAYFPARNRIINGLSRGVVIVEAAEKSGALITVDYALDEGRDVFAVPGSIFSAASKGTNRLIQQGAKLASSAADILQEYQLDSIKPRSEQSPALTIEQKAVYKMLSYDQPLSLEEMITACNLSASTLSYILLQLELQGLVRQLPGQQYLRIAREGAR